MRLVCDARRCTVRAGVTNGENVGKTVKKKKQGRRPSYSDSALPDGPGSMSTIDPNVVCPHCGALYEVSRLRWEGLVVRCPECGRTISAHDYDQGMLDIPKRASELEGQVKEFLQERDRFAVRHLKTRWSLLKRYYAWRMRRLNDAHAELLQADEEARKLQAVVPKFAESRYYTSRWFKLTGKPLRRLARGPLPAYTLVPRYRDDGAFELRKVGPGGEGWGILGEWMVFARLQQAVDDGVFASGPVLVLPNLYLTNQNSDEMDLGTSGSWGGSRFGDLRSLGRILPLYSQIDCLLITVNAVYIIEVKNNHSRIEVNEDGEAFARGRDGYPVALWRDAKQCSNHATAFATCFPEIPFGRIFEITVYSNAISFTTRLKGFRENAYIGCFDEGSGNFLAEMLREEARLSEEGPLFTTEEADALGEELKKTALDADGRKEYLHLERLDFLKGR